MRDNDLARIRIGEKRRFSRIISNSVEDDSVGATDPAVDVDVDIGGSKAWCPHSSTRGILHGSPAKKACLC